MTTDDNQPRRTPHVRDRQAAAERHEAAARAERHHPAHRAATATGLLRQITTTGAVYVEVQETYGVLVQLTKLTDLTGQAVEQARTWLMTQNRAGELGTDNEGDVGATIDALTAAIAQARSLSTALDAAAGHIGHLTGPYAPGV